MLNPSEEHVSALISGYLGEEIAFFDLGEDACALGVEFDEKFFIGVKDSFSLLKFGFKKGFKVVLKRATGRFYVGEDSKGEEVRVVFSGEPSLRFRSKCELNVGAYLLLDDQERLFIQVGYRTHRAEFLGGAIMIMEETDEILPVTVVLGTLEMTLSELLAIRPGQVLELPNEANLAIGGVQIAKGKVIEGKFHISKITPKLSSVNSDKNLRMEVV
jgi:hypothetical protein